MSSLTYGNHPGYAGQKLSDSFHYSQYVILPNGVVKISGQGGWNNDFILPPRASYQLQIDNAFDNIDRVLRAAGLRGLEDIYLIRSYLTDIESYFPYLTETMKKRLPHRPVYTSLSVPALGLPDMVIEIEVEAMRQG